MEFIQTYFLLFALILYFVAFIFFLFQKYKIKNILIIAAFIVHSIYLAFAGYYSGIYLFLKVVENPAFLPWAISLILIIMIFKDKDYHEMSYSLIFTIIFSFIAWLTPPSLAYFGPNKLTIWAILFFITEFFAQAFFFIGGTMALLFLLGKTEAKTFHNLLIWGFISHTLVHVTGGIWCFLGWAAIFQWVYVHLKSAAIWLYYANYLHIRFIPRWTERRRAYYAIAGAIIMFVFKYI
ncbi:MAG: hypothetical protein JW864_05420 [Spirochaetes bacterium]|nr:hypothetical protein [Spirochaetota bacterium]